MKATGSILSGCVVWLLVVAGVFPVMAADKFASHPPQRSLPKASQRPIGKGPAYFVDAEKGDDTGSGLKQQPWKTINYAAAKLKPGDTLYLRGGTYYQQVKLQLAGTEKKPITFRAYPGELVIIDGGLREFFEKPAEAWQPYEKGAPGEFQSAKTYPDLGQASGNFGDSLIPLQAYQFSRDLRSENQFSRPHVNGQRQPLYLGPGLWFDPDTQRIHARLAHTHVKAYAPGLYRGETDPRKLPLIVSGHTRTPLHLENCSHVRIQDVIVRGGGDNAVLVRRSNHIELDAVTIYVANRGLRVERTGHLHVNSSAFRGPMPPWGSRTASKYRTYDSHLLVPVGTEKIRREDRKYFKPSCHDFEISHCEFTDGHDGVYVGGVQRLRFHHNLVDNLNDDGVYISAWGPPGSGLHIFQNRISRCLTTFAFGLGRYSASDPSDGVYIYRNVIDLRGPVPYGHPGPDNPPALTSFGRISGDHGGPIWDPMTVYHNTFIVRSPQMRGFPLGWGGHLRGSSRRVMNNIFVETERLSGAGAPSAALDFQTDGNLYWSPTAESTSTADYFSAFRKSKNFELSKKQYPPGWSKNSRFGNPKFVRLSEVWNRPADYRLQSGSSAVDAGIEIPNSWPDPLRMIDKGKPDIGALPLGAIKLSVGLK